MSKIMELWKGNVSLPKTGWGYGLLITVVLSAIIHLLNLLRDVIELPTTMLLLSVAILIHSPFMAVAVWRSANKYTGPIMWRWFAQGSILCVVGIVAAGLLGYFPAISGLTDTVSVL